METIFTLPVEEVLRRTSERTPDLGGGPHAALAAAAAAALASMSSRYAGVDEAQVEALTDAAGRLRDLADADGAAFAPLLEAWQLPHDAPDRSARVAEAARVACSVPLDVCRVAVEIARTGMGLVESGKRDLRGDSAAAVHLADAAAQASAVLVRLNAGTSRAPDMVDEARALADQTRELSNALRRDAW